MDGLNWPQVEQQMQAMSAQMEELTRTTVMWMVVSVLLLVFLVAVLVVLVRMRSRNRKVEAWMVKEAHTLQERQDGLMRAFGAMTARPPARSAPQQRPMPQQPSAQPVQPQAQPRPAQAPPPQPIAPEPREPIDLVSTLNEMLAGNQPYNFVESVQALDPQLSLVRLTPRAGGDLFAKKVVLEPGGDGLFATASGDTALLFPNYSRFSATLDPKPIFDGAKHGGRIHSVLKPALLARQPDGTWLLTEKGRVQMRQSQ